MNDFSKVLKDIPYETRNLGVRSLEVCQLPLSTKSLEFLKDFIEKEKKDNSRVFIQAKVAKIFFPSAILLQGLGFYSTEIAFKPFVEFNKSAAYNSFRKDEKFFLPLELNVEKLIVRIINKDYKEEINQIKHIAASSFKEDRFHQDPNCPRTVADQRFVFWIDEQLQDPDIKFFILEYKNSVIAFASLKANNLILIALKESFQNKQLGFFFFLQIFKILEQEGFQTLKSSISASNPSMVNLCSKLGFKFKDPTMTLHYWTSGFAKL